MIDEDTLAAPAEAGNDPEHATRQTVEFVTFEMDGERYAFPMERVREIIRMSPLVRVPLGPPSVQGVANLRGRVLPVVDLRRCCGLPSVEADSTTRVIVVDGAACVGLTVDRISSVISVDPAQIEQGEAVQGAIRSDLLAAVVRAPSGMVTAIDVDRLIETQFSLLAGAEQARAAAGPAVDAAAGDDDDGDAVELVTFDIDGQEYALPIARVREIVPAPERIGRIPNCAPDVIGVLDLRGRVLPLLSMRRAFALPDAEPDPENRVIVVSLPGGRAVGLLMDAVREVVRVPGEALAGLPAGLAANGGLSEVEAVIRLEEGNRLVSVLDLDRLFADRSWDEGLPDRDGTDEPLLEADMTDDDEDDDRADEELLVVFRLDAEHFAVAVDRVQEIIRVPAAIQRVPNSHHFVDGVVNLRGGVLPVVDLRTRLGLPRLARDERQRIVVLTVGGTRTGFVVDAVTEVSRVPHAAMEPAPELSERQAAVVSQVAKVADNRMLLVIDSDELLPELRAQLAGAR